MSRARLACLLFALVTASIAACGGGGGSASTSSAAGATTTPAAASAPPAAATPGNVHPIVVNAGLGGNVNLAFASVTLCAPGSATSCQTIDNIVVDTGSSGLRVLASAIAGSLALTQETDARGNPVVECARFIDGYTWGPVKRADVKMAGESAASLPIQVIGDPGFSAVPARCAASGPSKNSAASMRANGIIGLSVFRQDCGAACTVTNNRGMYYSCAGTVCAQVPVALADQVQNPVALFAVNNNGVILQLPPVAASGAAGASGNLVFGIGTQTNNGLGSATVIGVDASGNFTTVYNGVGLSASFLDSGSNGLFFPDAIPICSSATAAPGFYCPVSTLSEAATLTGANGRSTSVSFTIANADALLSAAPTYTAFPNLGGYLAGSSFDWGLPFFYGRSVYTAIEGANTPAGAGPYVAF